MSKQATLERRRAALIAAQPESAAHECRARSMWRLADYQGQLIANLIVAGRRAPQRARSFRTMLAARGTRAGDRTFVAADRHRLEVNYYDYRRLMKRLNRRFGAVRRMKLEATAVLAGKDAEPQGGLGR